MKTLLNYSAAVLITATIFFNCKNKEDEIEQAATSDTPHSVMGACNYTSNTQTSIHSDLLPTDTIIYKYDSAFVATGLMLMVVPDGGRNYRTAEIKIPESAFISYTRFFMCSVQNVSSPFKVYETKFNNGVYFDKTQVGVEAQDESASNLCDSIILSYEIRGLRKSH